MTRAPQCKRDSRPQPPTLIDAHARPDSERARARTARTVEGCLRRHHQRGARARRTTRAMDAGMMRWMRLNSSSFPLARESRRDDGETDRGATRAMRID